MDAILNDELFWVWAARALAALVLLGVSGFVLPRLGMGWRSAWLAVRGYRDDVIKAGNQPTDPLWVAIGKAVQTVWPNFEVHMAAFWPVFIKALADALDKLAGEPASNYNVTVTAAPVNMAEEIAKVAQREAVR